MQNSFVFVYLLFCVWYGIMKNRKAVMCAMRNKILWSILIFAFVIAIVLGAVFLIRSKRKMTYEEKVAAFVEQNSAFETGQTVFVGDSITEGYFLPLYYHNADFKVYNRGISGDTTGWLLARLQPSLLELAPSRIVLMIGTNDINMGKNEDEIAEAYATILKLIASNLPMAEVFCVSVIPQNTKFSQNAPQNNARIQKLNQKIEQLASHHNYTYINLYDKLTDKNGLLKRIYSPDGLHLGVLGYAVWTDAMKEYL